VPIDVASVFSIIGQQTLRKFVDQKKISGYKTPTGQRRVNRESLQAFCGSSVNCQIGNKDEQREIIIKKNFLYARVSSKKQLDDLSRQIEYINRPEYAQYIIIKDTGSGINIKRKGLSAILVSCIQRTFGEVVFAHRDRLSRFAFKLIELIISKVDGKLTVLDSKNTNNSSNEQELSEDLLSIVHIYSCKQMGKRKYTTSRKYPTSSIQNSEDQDQTDPATKSNSE